MPIGSTDSGVFRGAIGPRGALTRSITGQNGGTVTLTVEEAQYRQIKFTGNIQGAIQIRIPGPPGMYWDVMNDCVHLDTGYFLVVSNINGQGTVNISQNGSRRCFINQAGLMDYMPGDPLQDTAPVWAWEGGNNGMSIPNAATATLDTKDSQAVFLRFTGGNQTTTVTFTSPTPNQVWVIHNARGFATTVIADTDNGNGVAIAANRVAIVAYDAGAVEMIRVTADTDPAT